jgi:4-hydroxybutyryl-CoA dehydratase/vinylacetyl-CoA-Delta-isomerase
LEKYLKGIPGVSAEDRMRMFRLVEKLGFGSSDVMSHIHGGGSPEAHRLALWRATDLEARKKMAKKLAGIKEQDIS